MSITANLHISREDEPVRIDCESQGVANTALGIYPVMHIGEVAIFATPEQLTRVRDTIDRWLATRPQVDAADADLAETVDLSAADDEFESQPETTELPALVEVGGEG